MKKIFISMILAISLLSSLVVPAFAANENSNTVPDDVIEAIGRVVSTMAFEKENYGFADVDLSKIQIGDVIPTYTLLEDTGVQATQETFYSILDEFDNLIALAAVFSDEENGTYAFVSSELVPMLNSSIATDGNVALVYDDRGVYCWNGTSATLLNYNNVIEGIEGRASLSDIPTAELSIVETNQVGATCELGLDLDAPSTIGYGDESAYVNAPVIRQPAGSNWCWAACMASIVKLEKNLSYSCKTMANKYTTNTAEGASITTAKSRLLNDFSLAFALNSTNNLTPILNTLGKGHIVYGRFTVIGAGNTMIVRVINIDGGTFSYMDPEATGANYKTGEILNRSGSHGDLVGYNFNGNLMLWLDAYLYRY